LNTSLVPNFFILSNILAWAKNDAS
jgi:hypothetical protein